VNHAYTHTIPVSFAQTHTPTHTHTHTHTHLGILRVDIRGDGTVTIVADTKAHAEAARLQLEMVTDTVAIHEDDVGWIIGKGGKTVRVITLVLESLGFVPLCQGYVLLHFQWQSVSAHFCGTTHNLVTYMHNSGRTLTSVFMHACPCVCRMFHVCNLRAVRTPQLFLIPMILWCHAQIQELQRISECRMTVRHEPNVHIELCGPRASLDKVW
jgi:hypothetical protein